MYHYVQYIYVCSAFLVHIIATCTNMCRVHHLMTYILYNILIKFNIILQVCLL